MMIMTVELIYGILSILFNALELLMALNVHVQGFKRAHTVLCNRYNKRVVNNNDDHDDDDI